MKIDITYIQEGAEVHAYATSGSLAWDQYLSQEDINQPSDDLDAIVTARAADQFMAMSPKAPIITSTIRTAKSQDSIDAKAFVVAKEAAAASITKLSALV